MAFSKQAFIEVTKFHEAQIKKLLQDIDPVAPEATGLLFTLASLQRAIEEAEKIVVDKPTAEE